MTAKQQDKKQISYADAGVDIDAGNALVEAIRPLAAATARAGSNPDLGGFGGLFDLKACGFDDPVLIAANDGVGTKLKVAIESRQHFGVGIDLVAMSVNDLVVQGAEPLFFLDYLACGKLDVDQARQIIAGISKGCQMAGCALIGGETAEMPGMYHGGDYDLAGFAVGAVERERVLPRNDIRTGDVILGLASSGPHSNGYSLIRVLVEKSGLEWDDKAPFDSSKGLAEALLTPTRVYVKPVLAVLRQTGAIKGMAHITGGGFTENLPRVVAGSGAGFDINLDSIDVPGVFGWLQQEGNISQAEMLKTFNCGIGLCVVVSRQEVDEVAAIFENTGERASVIGTISEHPGVRYGGSLKT